MQKTFIFQWHPCCRRVEHLLNKSYIWTSEWHKLQHLFPNLGQEDNTTQRWIIILAPNRSISDLRCLSFPTGLETLLLHHTVACFDRWNPTLKPCKVAFMSWSFYSFYFVSQTSIKLGFLCVFFPTQILCVFVEIFANFRWKFGKKLNFPEVFNAGPYISSAGCLVLRSLEAISSINRKYNSESTRSR